MTEMIGVQTGFADIDGASLYYEMAGEGPDLVLVHAGFVDRRMWDEQFRVFSKNYRVMRYDQRGFGNSKLTPGPFSHQRDLFHLMNYVGMGRAHLVGCSMGGAILIDFALEYPEMAASLVLVSSALGGYQFQGDMPRPLQELVAAMQEKDLERAADLAIQIWIAGPRRTPGQVDDRIRDRVREMSKIALPNFFVMEEPLQPPAVGRLNEISAPTLVITGEMDDASIAAIGDVLTRQIAGARRAVIAGAAHLPNMEKPDEFNRLVQAFLPGV